MATKLPPPTQLPAWQALEAHLPRLKGLSLRRLFSEDPRRGERLAAEGAGVYLDYSKHLVTDEVLSLLLRLAEESGLRARIEAMFQGQRINVTEHRAVLHVALRAPRDQAILLDGADVVPQVHAVLERMAGFARQVRDGGWRGHTGLPVRTVVNIGIGGSDLGPAMAYEALRPFTRRDLGFRFVANVDGADLREATQDLDPRETLFIISSKTFTTQETMANATAARDWALAALGDPAAVARHFVAVSAAPEQVAQFGIDPANCFGFWDWVGGRYSMDSAIGLSTMIAVGPEAFHAMLEGFHEMDEHFRSAPFDHNLPVLMALLTLWYSNFLGAHSIAVLPYAQYLKRFPAYLQQLAMESNGKRVTVDGAEVGYATSPVYWGEPGTNGQHSFYQLLHQGTRLVPCDFIVFGRPLGPSPAQHDMLLANALAQAEALAFGRSAPEVEAEGTPAWLAPHRVCPGNRPSSMLFLESLTPAALGRLVALYEHNVFSQAAILRLDAFDQWGVELGKVLARKILPELAAGPGARLGHDSSTNALIRRCQKSRG